MKRIALISLHTPTATNCRGASALPYHLMAFRPTNVRMEVWSFNLNGCSDEQIKESENALGIRIHTVGQPSWFRFLNPAPVRLFLPKPVLGYLPLPKTARKEITDYINGAESALWIYGEDIARMAKQFSRVPVVISGPDCEAMYYHRVLGMSGIRSRMTSKLRYTLMYHRYKAMTRRYPAGDSIRYHLVGEEDVRFLKSINPAVDVRFIRHPHYDISNHPKAPAAGNKRLKLLIAGSYTFTMAQAVDEAVESMKPLPQEVKDKFLVTFLGIGWEKCGAELRDSGFDVEFKGYVDDYAAEVSSHHIQLTPVAVGTGTKGKVLDAFANGLMVIGTPFALENIAVESGKECIEYCSGSDLSNWLTTIAKSPDLISRIAKAGQRAVLSQHSQAKIANEFFKLFQSTSSEMTI